MNMSYEQAFQAMPSYERRIAEIKLTKDERECVETVCNFARDALREVLRFVQEAKSRQEAKE